MTNLYYAYVFRIICEICGNAKSTYLSPLIKLQNKCVRIIYFAYIWNKISKCINIKVSFPKFEKIPRPIFSFIIY